MERKKKERGNMKNEVRESSFWSLKCILKGAVNQSLRGINADGTAPRHSAQRYSA
jgi:hypothetical protein